MVQFGFNYDVKLAWVTVYEDEDDLFPAKERDPVNDRHMATCRACNQALPVNQALHLRDWFLREFGIRFDALRWTGWSP